MKINQLNPSLMTWAGLSAVIYSSTYDNNFRPIVSDVFFMQATRGIEPGWPLNRFMQWQQIVHGKTKKKKEKSILSTPKIYLTYNYCFRRIKFLCILEHSGGICCYFLTLRKKFTSKSDFFIFFFDLPTAIMCTLM